MQSFLRALPVTAVGLLLTGIVRAQDELAKVQAGDEVHEAVAHHGSSPVPQFDPASFPGQLFWLVIIFALLYIAMSRLVLPKIGSVIESRESHIARDLQQAQQDRTLAGELIAAHEAKLAETRANAQAATGEAQAAAAQTQTVELGIQGTRLANDLSAAETRINTSRAAALAELAPAAAATTQAIIAKLAGRTADAARAQAEVTKALQARNVA